MEAKSTDCSSGYVAIIGRPNVGKSTLLNRILGQKISITTRKPQTTRHRILGIKTSEHSQVVYVDTPGLHREKKRAINRYMNKAASRTINDVDIIVFIVERLKWTDEDQYVLDKLESIKIPVILTINKIDQINDRKKLLPYMADVSKKMNFHQLIPISARTGKSVVELEKIIAQLLPSSDWLFPKDQVTDRSQRFLAAELIREKLMNRLGQELPYELTVEIEQFKKKKSLLSISAIIWVERQSQKAIIVGKKGEGMKAVGEAARKDMEKCFGEKIFLQLWVKVKHGWSNSERALHSLGYMDEYK